LVGTEESIFLPSLQKQAAKAQQVKACHSTAARCSALHSHSALICLVARKYNSCCCMVAGTR
jgi:hypothetical protein